MQPPILLRLPVCEVQRILPSSARSMPSCPCDQMHSPTSQALWHPEDNALGSKLQQFSWVDVSRCVAALFPEDQTQVTCVLLRSSSKVIGSLLSCPDAEAASSSPRNSVSCSTWAVRLRMPGCKRTPKALALICNACLGANSWEPQLLWWSSPEELHSTLSAVELSESARDVLRLLLLHSSCHFDPD